MQTLRRLKSSGCDLDRFGACIRAFGVLRPSYKAGHMKFGVLGTGVVGETIGRRLVDLGHEVKLGSRSATNEKASAWAKSSGSRASHGTFADAAAFGELLFNCTKGEASLDALKAAKEENLNGKVLIDISNALDGSKGFPPTLSVVNTDSLGEQLQRAFPKMRVVKSLNTMNCSVMVNPRALADTSTVFVSGNDSAAKDSVRGVLSEFGWQPGEIVDLGDIMTARGPEMYLPLWLRTYGAVKSGTFNIKIVTAKA